MKGIVTLDVGTTHIKGYLFSPQGEILEHAKHVTPFLNNSRGFSEIDPGKVFEITLSILKQLVNTSMKLVRVDSIVVSGMACSFIPVDRDGKPLYPCICWNDQRSKELLLQAKLDAIEGFIQQHPLAMNLPFRIQWFEKHLPHIVTDAYKWLNLTDFIVFHLSARKEFITDYSQASRTMLFDSIKKQWNSPVVDHFDIPVDKLPTPKPSGFVIGSLDKNIEFESSYRNTQLILGGHDHMFAALAGGIQDPSIALNSTGTSEAMVLPYVDHREEFSFIHEECNLESHIIDNQLLVVGYVASTGSILDWADRHFHLFKWTLECDLQNLWDDRVHHLPLFIPSGRRMQPSRAGRFVGLQPSFDDGQELSLSIMEGVSFEAKALLEHLNEKLHCKTDLVRLVGGAAKSVRFLQLKSFLLQKTVEVIHDVDMTSLGGFILSGLVLHYFSDAEQEARQLLCRQKRTILEPVKWKDDRYEERYQLYLREREA